MAKVGRTTVAVDHLQENLLKSVSSRFCHVDVTLLENVFVRSGLGSCWIVYCQNEDCLSRTLHFSDHNSLSAFAVRSCNFLIDISPVPELSFLPALYIGAEPGRAKEEFRITCMRMLRTNQSKITRAQPRCSRQCVAQCLFQLALSKKKIL